jgi:hypothetical protein
MYSTRQGRELAHQLSLVRETARESNMAFYLPYCSAASYNAEELADLMDTSRENALAIVEGPAWPMPILQGIWISLQDGSLPLRPSSVILTKRWNVRGMQSHTSLRPTQIKLAMNVQVKLDAPWIVSGASGGTQCLGSLVNC